MQKQKVIEDRIEHLIKEVDDIVNKNRGFAITWPEQDMAAGWLTSAINCVELLTPLGSPYQNAARNAKASFDTAHIIPTTKSARMRDAVGALRSVLTSLLADIRAGLITRLESRIAGETFTDFLSQAEWMAGRNEITSGVLAGVVFEDAIRRIGRDNDITHDKVDHIISDLVKAGVITEAKAKSARAAAHVRTKATHAEWAAYDIADVKNAIATTRDLIDAHLS